MLMPMWLCNNRLAVTSSSTTTKISWST